MGRKLQQARLRGIPRDRFGRAPKLERIDLLYMVVKRLHTTQGAAAILELLSNATIVDLDHVTQWSRSDGHMDVFFGFTKMSTLIRAIGQIPVLLHGQSIYAMVARSAFIAQ